MPRVNSTSCSLCGMTQPMAKEDEPYALQDEREQLRRLEMLSLPHVRPLRDFVERIGRAQHIVPYPDPCDGGIQAKVLLLLEAPGPRAVESGFISRNNADRTARSMCGLLSKATIPRRHTMLWNIVPWFVGRDGRIRPVTRADVQVSFPYLRELVDMLTELRLIVLMGRKSQSAEGQILQIVAPHVQQTRTWHPSPRVFARWPEKEKEIQELFNSIPERVR